MERRLEGMSNTLVMPDGRKIPLENNLDELLAVIRGEDHWLLPYYREIHEAAVEAEERGETVPNTDPGHVEIAQLLWAIDAGRLAAEEGEAADEGDSDAETYDTTL